MLANHPGTPRQPSIYKWLDINWMMKWLEMVGNTYKSMGKNGWLSLHRKWLEITMSIHPFFKWLFFGLPGWSFLHPPWKLNSKRHQKMDGSGRCLMPFLLGPDFRGPYFQGAKRLNLGSPNLRSRSIKALGRNKKTGGPWINDMTSIFERSKIPLKKKQT